jgi:hypothetical protein
MAGRKSIQREEPILVTLDQFIKLRQRVEQLEADRQPRTVLKANVVLVHDVSASVFDKVKHAVSSDEATRVVTQIIEWNREHAHKRLRLPDYDEICMATEMFGVNEIEKGLHLGWGSNYEAVIALCQIYSEVIFYTDQDGNSTITTMKLPNNLSIYVF